MAKRPLWPRVQTAMVSFVAVCLALGAFFFADHTIGRGGLLALQKLYELSRLPERSLGETGTTPAFVRGTLHTASPRPSPSGAPSAVWYAWVEEVRGSGRSSQTITVCSQQENTELELRAAGHSVALALLDRENPGAVLKGGFLASLPLDQVGLDFGPLHSSRLIPAAMRQRCGALIPSTGNLTYFEAAVPSGHPVTVLGCADAGTVFRCGTPPGLIAVGELRHVLRAYANLHLDGVRGTAAMVGIALSLLASALFKLREDAAGKS